jgi:hypothetical protein
MNMYHPDMFKFQNGVMEETDLKEMGISNDQERSVILEAVLLLNNRFEKQPNINLNQTVDDWLKSIHLDNYAELFRKHLYMDMERVRRVWEVELAAVLEIQKPAHRKRILSSVNYGYNQSSITYIHNGNSPNLEDLNKDLHVLVSNF